MHFPGLSCSGSGSRVLHRGADLVGPAFCPLPGPSSSSDQMLGEHTLPGVGASYHLPGLSVHLRCPMCLLWGADLWLRPSWWMSIVQDPGKTSVSNWELARSFVEDAVSGAEIAPFWLWLSPACLSASGGGWAGLQPASSPLVFTQSFVL